MSGLSYQTQLDFHLHYLLEVPISQDGFPSYVTTIPRGGYEAFVAHVQDTDKFVSGYYVFSNVGFNLAGDQALFYVDHICGLCGGGRYVLMQKVDGTWKVVEEDWTWIS